MRSLFVAALLFVWMPFILFKPHVGILLWDWVSHMNPHKFAAGFATNFPFLDFIAGATLVGMVISKDKKYLPMHPIVAAFVLYFLWTVITTIAGFNPDGSLPKFTRFSKVVLFALMSIMIMQSPNRLKAFVWIMIISMGYTGVKGGLFTILTGGGYRVEGVGGMIEDNNHLAMAMAMTVPLMIFLATHPPLPKFKWPLRFAAFLVPVSILGTQSRGGFAALAAVIFMLLMKTRRKIAMVALIVPIALGAYAFMPDSYRNRIKSSEEATEDSSFVGRVIMWKFSVNVADDNPVEGGGFDIFYNKRARELYLPPGHKGRAPHSIYFEVLAEHGYVGLILFLTVIFTGYYSAGSAARRYRHVEETLWLSDLCRAIQVSIVAYAVGGLTVNIATFDYFYHLLAVVVMCSVVGNQYLAETGIHEVKDDPLPKTRKWTPYRGGHASAARKSV